MDAHRRPTPINPEQRRLIVTESAPPEQVGSGQRLAGVDPTFHIRGNHRQGEPLRASQPETSRHHRQRGKASGGHMTEAMRQLYDHSVPVVSAAVKPKKKG